MKTRYWVKKIHRCFFLSFMIFWYFLSFMIFFLSFMIFWILWYFHCMPNAWVAACILFTKWSFNLLLKTQAKYTAHWFLKNIQFSYVKYVSEGDIFHLFYSSCPNLRNSLAKSQCLPSCLPTPHSSWALQKLLHPGFTSWPAAHFPWLVPPPRVKWPNFNM